MDGYEIKYVRQLVEFLKPMPPGSAVLVRLKRDFAEAGTELDQLNALSTTRSTSPFLSLRGLRDFREQDLPSQR
jgi:hypothetical protein